ncbi:FemAB family XrtA/PEP-CTERM system-associated protein [Vibrio salinus]|uniref:FemAB family XrtA/PEP-CTERM system-associated protein n=1 Tax=Vibrio salinus TaxID=2899784 RepID=UPI001E4BAB49|nr:FemAB family XrtA/PEP-CTERM system-associated protein [Vibrio salinus]MCE0493262.1 FemAB family PEP-CTERM system-associated protein [Vibrio salinus]
MNATLKIRKITDQDFANWDHYVDNHSDGTFFHLSGWINVITEVFNHRQHYLLATRGEEEKIVGLLPLFEQKSLIFGHALISTPFCVYGGVIANDEDIRHELEAKAYKLGCDLNVDYVEIRDKYCRESREPWQAHCHHSTFFTTIEDSSEQILTSIKRKQRAVVRHSLNNELSWNNTDNPELCYDVYAESVRNLGTPVFSKKLFLNLKRTFGNQCETLIINDNQNHAISSVLSFYYKGNVLPYYGGGTLQARSLKSNDYMYYQLMCTAREKGIKSFDFGRSKHNSGSFKYKKNWGMQEEKLHYKVALVKSKQLPNFSPNNPKYKFFISMWKKMPLTLSRVIGPNLSKYLG